MNWYKDNKEEWRKIIEVVAAEEHKSVYMIEKDCIQSLFLLELSKSVFPFVFKGGTSLSKGYGLIKRFSEDIDLAMNKKLSEGERKKVKTFIIEKANELGMQLDNGEDVQSRKNYNKYIFMYDSLFSEVPLEIIIETNFHQNDNLGELQNVSSYVGRFVEKNNIILPVEFAAESVEMIVQSLENTFIEKVFAICDYRIKNKQDRESRHLYDIYKLIPYIKISDELVRDINSIREQRMLLKTNPSAQLEYNISDILKDIIDSHFYEMDYNDITKKLLYEDVSYDDVVKDGIAVVARMNIFD